jgi:hypothetical protein
MIKTKPKEKVIDNLNILFEKKKRANEEIHEGEK